MSDDVNWDEWDREEIFIPMGEIGREDSYAYQQLLQLKADGWEQYEAARQDDNPLGFNPGMIIILRRRKQPTDTPQE
ncbi:MAG TPA: hypothetical protein VH393_04015 [Ktedonobacterales bacterium]